VIIIITLLAPQTHKTLQQWQFRDRSSIRIGRLKDNDVALQEFAEVSRYHLEIERTINSDGRVYWRLISKGTNGTFLNGVLVTQATIDNNSLIQLAQDGPILKLELKSSNLPNACIHTGNASSNLFCIHCGQPLVEKEEFIRNYQILKTLGRGGMGTTYLAWDKSQTEAKTPQLLVLKQMNADIEQIAKARELFLREARILQSLHHPAIPKYYDFFVENEQKYLAMELIHGQNLEQLVYQKGPVTPQQAIDWAIQLCDILKYLHSLQPPLVHRDVKPANLIARTLDRTLMLLDFGAVKEIGTPLGTRIGAEGYTAPEQDRGQPCPQSDIYAIGPTLIFLLTGEAPLKYYCLKNGKYKLDASQIPTISRDLAKTIERACEPRIVDRYQNSEELAIALAVCQ
jgi:serine/threonine-protein kinase